MLLAISNNTVKQVISSLTEKKKKKNEGRSSMMNCLKWNELFLSKSPTATSIMWLTECKQPLSGQVFSLCMLLLSVVPYTFCMLLFIFPDSTTTKNNNNKNNNNLQLSPQSCPPPSCHVQNAPRDNNNDNVFFCLTFLLKCSVETGLAMLHYHLCKGSCPPPHH